MGNIKLRVLNFGYVMAVDVTIMCMNFQMNLWVLFKLWSNSLNIAPNELKLGVWDKGGKVINPTKFEGNL